LKIGKIVIDPGHGGHDTGTIGRMASKKKDLVLEVGRRLGKLLQARLGADVVYTRSDDNFHFPLRRGLQSPIRSRRICSCPSCQLQP